MQKEDLPSHKLRDHAYEYKNVFGLKEDNLSQRNCQNQLSHPGLSHIEQECRESFPCRERFPINKIRTKASNTRKAKL